MEEGRKKGRWTKVWEEESMMDVKKKERVEGGKEGSNDEWWEKRKGGR